LKYKWTDYKDNYFYNHQGLTHVRGQGGPYNIDMFEPLVIQSSMVLGRLSLLICRFVMKKRSLRAGL